MQILSLLIPIQYYVKTLILSDIIARHVGQFIPFPILHVIQNTVYSANKWETSIVGKRLLPPFCTLVKKYARLFGICVVNRECLTVPPWKKQVTFFNSKFDQIRTKNDTIWVFIRLKKLPKSFGVVQLIVEQRGSLCFTFGGNSTENKLFGNFAGFMVYSSGNPTKILQKFTK